MFDADKNRMIGLPYSEKNYDDMLSRFHLVPERNGRTDRQTDRRICYINIARQYADDKKMIHYTVLRERKPPTRRLRSTGPSIHVKDWGHTASGGNAATGPLGGSHLHLSP